MKKAIILLFILCFGASVWAHNNEPTPTRLISGKVLDKQTGEALAGVKIQVKGSDTFCYTDLNGNYLLSVITKPETEISIDMIGYRPFVLKTSETGLEKELYLSPR